MEKTMDAMKTQSSAPPKMVKPVESESREPVRPAPAPPSEALELCRDVIQAGTASVSEIEKLMAELQAARDYLQTEGERLRRDAARYAHLTHTALSSVKIISENMDKWRETVPANLAQVA
jgi:hypothetical protein